MNDRETNEAALARILCEGAQLYIIVYTHRHGEDAWLRISMEPPDMAVEIAGIESWEGEDHGDYLSIEGPFDIFDPQWRAPPAPAARRFRNFYEHCDVEWELTWDSMCNDKCPKCNKEIEPYNSERFSD